MVIYRAKEGLPLIVSSINTVEDVLDGLRGLKWPEDQIREMQSWCYEYSCQELEYTSLPLTERNIRYIMMTLLKGYYKKSLKVHNKSKRLLLFSFEADYNTIPELITRHHGRKNKKKMYIGEDGREYIDEDGLVRPYLGTEGTVYEFTPDEFILDSDN